ncbi:hypothetical protein J3E68DRAFT_381404 [Trichoderma sp. SZMC 28012]
MHPITSLRRWFLKVVTCRNARIAGMSTDLNLIGDRYDWLLTIFYIPYIIFEFLGHFSPFNHQLRLSHLLGSSPSHTLPLLLGLNS